MHWLRRYRERKELLAVARLLAAVDAESAERRVVRRRVRVTLGAGA